MHRRLAIFVCYAFLALWNNIKFIAAFVQDDNDVQYLLDNIPMSMHKVSCNFPFI